MGHKVHPYVLRIGFGKNWQSRWFVDKRRVFAQFLEEDIEIRKIVKSSYSLGSISSIVIERVSSEAVRIRIRTSRPGMIIGRRGQEIEKVKAKVSKYTKKEVYVDVEEVLEPALEAQLVAEGIAFQIMRRVNFKRAMKKAIQQALALGCEGIRVKCKGRLGGLEIARSEGYKEGKVPLQTFRSDIDYGFCVPKTTYGTIGVKVWMYGGEKRLGSYMKPKKQDEEAEERT